MAKDLFASPLPYESHGQIVVSTYDIVDEFYCPPAEQFEFIRSHFGDRWPDIENQSDPHPHARMLDGAEVELSFGLFYDAYSAYAHRIANPTVLKRFHRICDEFFAARHEHFQRTGRTADIQNLR